MTHAAEGLLQAWIDGEVEGSAAAELEHHLSACAGCAAELQRLRAAHAQVAAALALLDGPRTGVATEQAWWQVRNRARRPAVLRFVPTSLGRAAAIVLAAAGVASAAIPGSPVRRVIVGWFGGDAERVETVRTDAPAAEAPVTTPAAPAEPRRAEMTVLPVEGRVRVLIWSAATHATVRVNFVRGERVSVQAGGEEGDVRFRSGPGRIEVYDLGTAQATIELPQSLTNASIEVDGRQFLFKDGDQLRVPGPVVERSAQSIVFRVPN